MRRLVAALALALPALCAQAQQPASTVSGQAWPSRPVHMIVPFPAGSSPDVIARILAEKLAPVLHQPVVVENRPGAGGNVGTAVVARAAPDGYTVGLSIQGPLAVNKVLYKKMEYDPFMDLAPVTLVATSPNLLVVDPRLCLL
jgi:tripartite-type tricarboxylate transporter receptor subunit TctC